MRRTVLAMVAVAGLAGCPKIGRTTYRFDLVTGKGTLILENIGTDDPVRAARDFADLVNDYLLGGKVQEDHPSWRVGERRMVEQDGRLDGIVSFTFDRPIDVGLYQHDKKSGYLWCSEGDKVASTSGVVVAPYPNCVIFDRKAKQVEVTVVSDGSITSLLPQYATWDGNLVPTGADHGGAGHGESFQDVFGIGSPPTPAAPNLSTFLPEVDVPAAWKSLGLPISGSKPVFSSERTYEASHPDTSPAEVVARYQQLLTKAGYASEAPGADPSVWTKDGAAVSITATSAGSTVVVDLAR